MATKKITQLTELSAAPADTDLLAIVDVSEGADANKTKKITVANLFLNVLSTLAIKLIYRRQGGSATHWNIGGTTTYTPSTSNTKMQTGCRTFSLASPGGSAVTFVTFPVAFTSRPIVFVGGEDTGLVKVLSAKPANILTNGFDLDYNINIISGTQNANVFWMAIGE